MAPRRARSTGAAKESNLHAWGCHARPTLKSVPSTLDYVDLRHFRWGSVPSERLRSAELGTRFGTRKQLFMGPGREYNPGALDARSQGVCVEVNGVAHVVFRAARFEECIAFYDQLMPRLGLRAVHRTAEFVYYIGGRTAVAIRKPDPELANHAHIENAPGIDHLCFRARSRDDIDELYPFVRSLGAEMVRAPEEGPWAPGYYSLSFRDPEGIRLEVNHVPGKGVFAEGGSYQTAPGYPLTGRRGSTGPGD